MQKADYHQRQDRVLYPNYPKTNTTNRKKYCGLLLAGFFIFMMAFSAGPLYGGVGKNGAVTESYPMGASGVAYSSQGGGWSVMGLSGITRQNKHGVPGFTNDDIFELDGMELVYASETTEYRLYHTQRESYQRIRYYNPTSPSTSYWEITTKDGTKRYYGNSGDSRIEGRNKAGQSLGIRVWALQEVKDINNNSTKYYYNEDTAHGDYYLSKRISGKNGCATYGYSATLLHYETDPNPRVTYGSGSLVEIDQRLRKSTSGYAVEVKTGTSSSGSGGYQTSAYKIEYVLSSGGKSLISKITPYGDDGSSPMPATEYEYNDFEMVFGEAGTNFDTGYDSAYASGGTDSYFLKQEKIEGSDNYYWAESVVSSTSGSNPDRILGTSDDSYANIELFFSGGSITVEMENISQGGIIEIKSFAYFSDGAHESEYDGMCEVLGSENGSDWIFLFGFYEPLVDYWGEFTYHTFALPYSGSRIKYLKVTNTGCNECLVDWYIDSILLTDSVFDVTADLIDMNGDGMPDRVRKESGGNFYVRLNEGRSHGFSSTEDNWYAADSYNLRDSNYKTNTNADLIDIDGDGQPDRVRKTTGDLYVRRNNGSGFDSEVSWDTIDNYRLRQKLDDGPNKYHLGNIYDFIDMNGDGLPDRVKKEYHESNNTHLYVQLNTGSGFETTYDDWGAIDKYPLSYTSYGANTYDIIDMNGDGLPDRVKKEPDYETNSQLYVRLNTGSGFETSYREWGATDNTAITIGSDLMCTSSVFRYMDVNRDGLLDRVFKDFNLLSSLPFYAKLNKGSVIDNSSYNTYIPTGVDPDTEPADWLALLHVDSNIHQPMADFIDIDGDGFPDRVYKVDTESFKVFLNQAGAADLLKTVKNGMGGTITYTYKPAGKKDNNPNLQNKTWVVDTVTADDGLGGTYSTATTNYEYYGGLYDTDDKEFRGFEKVIITDPAGNKAETHYYQDDVNKDLVKKSMTRDATNNIYDYVYNTYEDHCTGASHSTHYGYGISGVYAPLLIQVDKYISDGDTQTDNGTSPAGTCKHVQTEMSYDDPNSSTAKEYGDPYKIENLGDLDNANDQTRTYFKYAVDTGYWVVVPWYKKVQGTNGQNATYFTQTEEKYYYDGPSGYETDLGYWLSESNVDEGRLKRVSSNTGSQWIHAKRIGYDSYGNVTHVQDAKDETTQTVYDSKYRSFPVKTIMPTVSAGTFASYNYYDSYSYTGTDTTTISNNITRGRPVMARDINSQFTKTYYDTLGRVTDIRKPGDESGDATIQYDYHFYTSASDPAYIKTTLKDGLGGLVSYAYSDGLGRTVQTKKEGIENETAKWIVVDSWSYFDSGNHYTISETTAPYFSTTSSFNRNGSPTGGRTKTVSYLSNSDGKVTWVEAPDGTDSYTYSKRFVTTTRNARNYGGTATVDGLGNVVETKAYSDTYSYGSPYRTDNFYYNTGTGQLVKKIEDYGTSKNNVTTTMTYDWLGRNTSTTDPDSGTWNYYYDSRSGYTTSYGNLIAQRDAKGNETKLEYDELNRVIKKTYPGSGNYINYRYDYYGTYDTGAGLAPLGHLVRIHKYESGSEALQNAYKYDIRGRTAGEWIRYNGSGGYYTYYSHDAMGRIDTITYPDSTSEVVKHTYGNGGSLDMLGTTSDTDKYIDDIYHDAFGRMTRLEYNNGINHAFTAYSYYGASDNYRLKNLTAREGDAATSNMMNFEYDYDAVGNITRIDSGNNNFYGDAHDQVFTYDNLNRLTGQTNDFYGGNSGSATSYNYDSINRIVNKNGITTYTYSGVNAGLHAATSVAGLTYTYDANGNMRYKTESCDFDFDGDVDETDLSLFVADYGRTDCSGDCQGDFDCDGDVDGTDLSVISANIGRTDLENISYTFDSSNRLAKVSGYATNVDMAAAEEILLSEDFSNGLPSDWSVTNNNAGNIWTYDSYDGRMEIIFSSSANTEDSKLITKSMDCSYSVGTTLSFYEEWMGGYGSYWSDGYIYVSTDGGSTWTEAAHPHHCDINAPLQRVSGTQTIDISSYADGESDVKIAFRYHGNYDYFWYIDNVTVRSGGLPSGYSLLSEDFSGGLPSYWSITNDGTGNTWTYSSYYGNMGIRYSSSANTEDSKLITKSIDCSSSVGTTLSFDETWKGGYGSYWSDGYVYVSTDGGSTWIEAAHPHHCDINAPEETVSGAQTIDISSYADGEPDVKIAFRYHGNYDWYWYIYNVEVKSDAGYNIMEVSGDAIAQYSYDHAGNRVKKIENDVTTYYINGYYEVEGSTSIKYYYANGQRIAKNDNGTLTFYHNDHLGGSSRITNTSGTEVKRLGYMPYGSDAYSSGSGDEPYYKFTGKEEDATGLYYYGARYYDPALGRFISSDNYGDNYAYCNNNPLKYVDPDGNHPVLLAGMAIGGAAIFCGAVTYAAIEGVGYLGADPEKVARGQEISSWFIDAGSIPFVFTGQLLGPSIAAKSKYIKPVLESKYIKPVLESKYVQAGLKSAQGGNAVNAFVSTAMSVASGDYNPVNDVANWAGSEITMLLGGKPIAAGKKYIGGVLNRLGIPDKASATVASVASTVTFGNLYGIPAPFAWYAKKGTFEGWEDAYWDTRGIYGWSNTAAGVTNALIVPEQYEAANTAIWRGIGTAGRIMVEDQGYDANAWMRSHHLGFFPDLYDSIREKLSRGNNSVNNTTSPDLNNTDVNNTTNTSRTWPGSCGPLEGVCLASGTRIEISKSGKDVDKMAVGDLVLAKVEKDGEVGFFNVSKVHKDRSDELVLLTLSTGEVLKATPGHLFRVNNDWKMAGQLNTKDVLKNKDGNDVKIKKVEKKKGSFPVYNITVDNAHTFYAGESKVLVKSK